MKVSLALILAKLANLRGLTRWAKRAILDLHNEHCGVRRPQGSSTIKSTFWGESITKALGARF